MHFLLGALLVVRRYDVILTNKRVETHLVDLKFAVVGGRAEDVPFKICYKGPSKNTFFFL